MWKMQEHFSTKESIQRKGDLDAISCASRFQREVIEGASCPSITAIHP
jgi:hypothetical protein